ncbi:MAG: hypothetical protein ACJASQ_000327 [Crocinitomicaceae bacterium]|jgi:hypothetical protein
MKTVFTIALVSALLVSCQSTGKNRIADTNPVSNEKKSAIKPIANVDAQSTIFQVEANQADTILLPNGGSIVFEKNSFADSEGKVVKGKVDVQWEEFHSLEDIMLSGIPMKYDSAGVAHDLVSGGMFTISATQKKKEVEMAEGKSAQVNLVSLQDTPCYNFYELDEETGDWAYETTQNGEVIEVPEEAKDEAPETDVLQIELMTDNIEELQDKDIVGWKTLEPLSRKDRNILGSKYRKSKLEATDAKGEYLAKIVIGKEIHNYKVKPYFMSDAVKDSKVNNAELTAETEALLKYANDVASGKVIRSIEIDDFGTYNWDVVNKRENSKRMIASFDFPDETDTRIVSLFLISPDENIIVNYNASGDKMFSFDPDKRNCIIAILPDNSLVSFSDKDFDAVRAAKRGTSYEFKMKPTKIKLKSAKDISNHLEELI